jgi:hypothetical protein
MKKETVVLSVMFGVCLCAQGADLKVQTRYPATGHEGWDCIWPDSDGTFGILGISR